MTDKIGIMNPNGDIHRASEGAVLKKENSMKYNMIAMMTTLTESHIETVRSNLLFFLKK